jgi:hypothetical protein
LYPATHNHNQPNNKEKEKEKIMSLLNLNSPAGQSPRGKKSLKMWMGAGLVVAVLGIGSTFAANISINQDETTEFGQGQTRTVYCGAYDEEGQRTDNDGEESITVSPISKFVNGEVRTTTRVTRAAVPAVPENSFTARFATSSYSGSSDFIVSATQTKVVNNRTGVWLTKRGNEGTVTVATNQDESTFSTQQRNDYVFSQTAAFRTINSVSTRGFYKVNDTREEKIVISAAIAARAQEEEEDEQQPHSEFDLKGVVISDIPYNCRNKNFVISGYERGDEDAKTLITVTTGGGGSAIEITEIAAKWTRSTDTVKVSRDRTQIQSIADYVTASQTSGTLSLIFDKEITGKTFEYLKTDDLSRLVIETQENTLG